MLYKVKKGFADKSYGIFVAEMLNFPASIINDAKSKLADLENFKRNINSKQKIELEKEENKENISFDLKELAKTATKAQKLMVIKLFKEHKEQLEKADPQNKEDLKETFRK